MDLNRTINIIAIPNITKARVLNKLQGTFIDGIAKYIHNDRIHGHVNQIRGSSGGTVTGRFSMYAPNLQQMPIRSEFGSEVRRIFLPEMGEYWISADYSQQEPRLLTHFALLKRTAKKNKVEIFRVTSGPKKTQNALKLLNMAIYNITKERYIKKRTSCIGCVFHKTEHCP